MPADGQAHISGLQKTNTAEKHYLCLQIQIRPRRIGHTDNNNRNMKEIIDFLARLEKNNNREWFQAHKSEYLSAQEEFNAFTEKLIAGIAEFDNTINGLTAKDCTYRIYRDTRFSPDKRPYKCHLGAFVCPQGKKSGFSGYYFQVGPQEAGYPGGNMLASGNYQFEPKVMRALRDDICNDDGEFSRTLRKAPLFSLDQSDMLKRVPNGYPKNAPYSPYLMYRSYCLLYEPGKRFMLEDHLLERTLAAFRTTQPFIAYLNRAISFVNEENTSF